MKGDILFNNLFNIFIVSLIVEAAVMAVFSLAAFKYASNKKPIEISRDFFVLIVSVFICFNVSAISLFNKTGLNVPHPFDLAITSLVMVRLANLVRDFFASIRFEK